MMTARVTGRWTLTLACAVVLTGGTAHAQETLSRIKAFYASAAYEEALTALSTIAPELPPVEAAEAAAYRVFCLLALGRTDDARTAVEALVRIDPFYRPGEDQASPRVRAFFADVRQPMLGDVALQTYAAARAAFDRKELRAAADGFDRVLRLLDEIGDTGGGAADLRVLVAGFKDLADLAVAREAAAAAEAEARRRAAVPAEPPDSPEPTAPPEPPVPAIYTQDDAGVTAPVVLSRPMPPWTPPAVVDRARVFAGVIEVVVDEQGQVESVVMREAVHALYDPLLVRTAKGWRFAPATKDGAPVKYRYRIGVRVGGDD